ncbi:hypothetical protein Tco_0133612 [Tanacetum coccineum]
MTIELTTISPPSPPSSPPNSPPFSTLFSNYSIGCSSSKIKRMVYESNHESSLATGLIHGPCEVLPPSKFVEETGVRTRSRARGGDRSKTPFLSKGGCNMEDPDGTLASVAQCIEQLQQISLSAQDNEYNLKQLLELIDTHRNAFTAVGSHSQAVPVLVSLL